MRSMMSRLGWAPMALLWLLAACGPADVSDDSASDSMLEETELPPPEVVSDPMDEPDPPVVEDEPEVAGPEALPEFAVPDVNPASLRYEEDVSPRDYLGQISAWYFGHAT